MVSCAAYHTQDPINNLLYNFGQFANIIYQLPQFCPYSQAVQVVLSSYAHIQIVKHL